MSSFLKFKRKAVPKNQVLVLFKSENIQLYLYASAASLQYRKCIIQDSTDMFFSQDSCNLQLQHRCAHQYSWFASWWTSVDWVYIRSDDPGHFANLTVETSTERQICTPFWKNYLLVNTSLDWIHFHSDDLESLDLCKETWIHGTLHCETDSLHYAK